jgi:hypothetical protein
MASNSGTLAFAVPTGTVNEAATKAVEMRLGTKPLRRKKDENVKLNMNLPLTVFFSA